MTPPVRAPNVLALLTTLAALAPATASASSVVLLPRTAGSGVDEGARAEAVETAAMVLENEGWAVHRTEEVAEELPPGLAICGPDDECAHELRALLDVDVAVGLRLWGDEGGIDHVAVQVTGIRGVGHRAVATVTEEAPLPFAMAEAIRAALGLWSEGVVPEGARGMDEPNGVDPEERSWESTALNWFLGGIFVLGSAPMLGYGINTAVRHGDCLTEGPAPDTCVERVEYGNGAGAFTVMGAITLVAGVVFWIAQPIQISVRADSQAAALTFSGAF